MNHDVSQDRSSLHMIPNLFRFLAGITRLPVLEGEVSHVEIPRTSQSLGVTIVGGADTPLVSEKERRTDMGECCSTKEPILSLNGRQKKQAG